MGPDGLGFGHGKGEVVTTKIWSACGPASPLSHSTKGVLVGVGVLPTSSFLLLGVGGSVKDRGRKVLRDVYYRCNFGSTLFDE